MKVLLLFVTLLPGAAFAGSLECAGPGLAYSLSRPDGGAPIGPSTRLLLNGTYLIHMTPFQEGFVLASFELTGDRRVLKTEKKPGWVNTTFESQARVVKTGDTDPVFDATVECLERRYVGPPRP